MQKRISKHTFSIFMLAAAMLVLGSSLAAAQDLTIDVKPCYQCPTGTTNPDGSFTCPDNNGDGEADWVSCGIPSINLCSKGKIAVALLDYAEKIDPAKVASVTFEGASPLRSSLQDVDHDMVNGEADDLVYHFSTRALTDLRAKVSAQEGPVQACLTITLTDGTTLTGCDDVVAFMKGSCKGL